MGEEKGWSVNVPLLNGENEEGSRQPSRRVVIGAVCGFLVLILLAALIGFHNAYSGETLYCAVQGTTHGRPILSRGVSAGVSEKTNRHLGAKPFPGWRHLGAKPFPGWSNTMLSWQRTAFHFQPDKNWMNDPNGPVYYKEWYHFFYQYNPNDAVWGDIVWGHAVSRDMIHWLYLPIAMVPDQWYDANGVWTGSATILSDGQLVMLYTGSTNESVQVQNLAYPADPSDPLLLNWTKYDKNPVLSPPPGIHYRDFRDPTTAMLTSEGKWRISIGSKINKTGIALIYDTEDFKNFELKNGWLRAVQGTGMWECVDFYPVSSINDVGLDTSAYGDAVKHVVKVSLDDDRNDYYAIGSYDEKLASFLPDDVKNDVGIGLRYDYGNFYASKTFFDPSKQRRILWGWITEYDSECVDRTKGWASLQGIPRTVRLDRKTWSNLIQWPVEEVNSLRLRSSEFKDLKAKPGSVVPLQVETATQLDIVAEFEVDKEALETTLPESDTDYICESSGGASGRGALGPFGLLVLADAGLSEFTPLYFYVSKGLNGSLRTTFCSDQSRSSVATNVNKKVLGSVVPVFGGEKLSLRVLVDHSIVESFAQGGRTCVTSRVYPTRAIYGAAKLFVFNNATDATVTASIKVWQMNSAFIRPYHPETDT